MSTKQKKLSDFLEGVEEQEKTEREENPSIHGSGTYDDGYNTRLDVPFDEVFVGYYLEGYTDEIPGKYGVSTAVRLTSPTGEKCTMWLSSFEQAHFLRFVDRLTLPTNPGNDEKGNELPKGQGLSLPVKFSFCRTKELSEKTGNEFNKFVPRLDAYGEEVQFELDSLPQSTD